MDLRKSTLSLFIGASVAVTAFGGLRSIRRAPASSRGPVHRRLRGVAQQRSLFDISPPSDGGIFYQWMWGDAEEFGDHSLAEADIFQWSDWLSVVGIVADLEAYKTPENNVRPVELTNSSADHEPGPPLRFVTIDEAIEFLGKFTTTQPPSIVEKEVEKEVAVHVADKCTESSPLNSTQALAFMPLGSALTIAVYIVCKCFTCVFWRICGGRKARESDALVDDIPSDEDPELRMALTGGRDPQPYQGNFQESELRALLADIEEEMKALPGLPGGSKSQPSASALRAEAVREVERVLNARGTLEIFGGGTESQQRTEYRRLVRLLHPDKKIIDGQRASLALRRVVECYTALRAAR